VVGQRVGLLGRRSNVWVELSGVLRIPKAVFGYHVYFALSGIVGYASNSRLAGRRTGIVYCIVVGAKVTGEHQRL
jgi:hypothetical protein